MSIENITVEILKKFKEHDEPERININLSNTVRRNILKNLTYDLTNLREYLNNTGYFIFVDNDTLKINTQGIIQLNSI